MVGLTLALPVAAQAAPPDAAPLDDAFIQKQFGSTCKAEPGFTQMVTDLDGDGIQDIVIVARCKNPIADQAENNFKVIDPYFSFYGYGDPRISSQFSTDDPARRGLAILIIHGSGPEAWRADEPKAKFAVINLPFKDVHVKKLGKGKKTQPAIFADETGADEVTSVIYWDGKKYKYQPMGSSME